MQLSLGCYQLQVATHFHDTIFPDIEDLFEELPSSVKGRIEHIAEDRKYRHVIDMIFCLSFPRYEKACRAFYADKGPPMRDLVSKKKIKAYNMVMKNLVPLLGELDWVLLGGWVT